MLRSALKEWAVICRVLAEGRQALLLRKGGIAESGGEFELEHPRFWLFPTYTHQQQTGIQPRVLPLLAEAEAERPPAGRVRLSHFAEATGVYRVNHLASALLLSDRHVWSEETIRARFAYRWPGLFVIPLRVYRAAEVFDLEDTAAYAGCRSWVDLGRDLPTDGATPVLDDAAFQGLRQSLDRILNPTALA